MGVLVIAVVGAGRYIPAFLCQLDQFVDITDVGG